MASLRHACSDMNVICVQLHDNFLFYIHTNNQELLTNFVINFFILFVSAWALFSFYLTPRLPFSVFFLSEAFFYYLFYHHQTTGLSSVPIRAIRGSCPFVSFVVDNQSPQLPVQLNSQSTSSPAPSRPASRGRRVSVVKPATIMMPFGRWMVCVPAPR